MKARGRKGGKANDQSEGSRDSERGNESERVEIATKPITQSKKRSTYRNPFLNLLDTSFRYCILPVPVVLRRLADGRPHRAQAVGFVWVGGEVHGEIGGRVLRRGEREERVGGVRRERERRGKNRSIDDHAREEGGRTLVLLVESAVGSRNTCRGCGP